MHVRALVSFAAIALTLTLTSAAQLARSAEPPDPNPFHAIDVAALVSRSSDVRALANGELQLRRTGDTIARASVAGDSLCGPAADGRYLLVVPFTNAAGAQHSALVFAADAKEAYQVGGFAARGDHLFVSLNRSIIVAFFARSSGGRTYANGGPAPTSTVLLTLEGRRLAEIDPSAPVRSVANVPNP